MIFSLLSGGGVVVVVLLPFLASPVYSTTFNIFPMAIVVPEKNKNRIMQAH